MSLYFTPIKPFFEHNLIEELYSVNGKLMICTLAGWQLAAVFTAPDVIENVGGYAGLFIDQEYVEGIFAGENRTEHMKGDFFFNEESLKEMIRIKEKITSGEMESLYDPDFVKDMKKKYIEQHQDVIDKYGNPPVFSEKKAKTTGILTFLLGGFGGQFFYIGKPLLGILCIAISVFSCATMFFAPMLIMGCVVLYGTLFLLLADKVKDKHGRYITRVKTQERIKQICRTINTYEKQI